MSGQPRQSGPTPYRTAIHDDRGWVLKEDADRVRAERDRYRRALEAHKEATCQVCGAKVGIDAEDASSLGRVTEGARNRSVQHDR